MSRRLDAKELYRHITILSRASHHRPNRLDESASKPHRALVILIQETSLAYQTAPRVGNRLLSAADAPELCPGGFGRWRADRADASVGFHGNGIRITGVPSGCKLIARRS